MLEINPPRKVYDVCIIGSGAGGGTAAKVLTEGGLNVVDARGRPAPRPRQGLQRARVALPAAPSRRRHRRAPARHRRRVHGSQRVLGHRRRALHHRARILLPLVPLSHRRRPHQPLGPHRAALRPCRFPPPLDGWRGRRLAHHLRGTRALLRQGRSLHRRVRLEGERPQRSRRRVHAAAQAALHRNPHQEGLRPTPHHLHSLASRHPDQAAERPRRVPLLRAMRTRLPHRVQLLLQPGHDSARSRHGPFHHDRQRHGARNHRQRHAERPKPSPTSTRPRAPSSASTPRPSSLPAAPANRRASC